MNSNLLEILSLEFEPGDLVRLANDELLEAGLGVVLVVERDLTDLDDAINLIKALSTSDSEDLLPSKPQLLILWASKKMWFYSSDVIIHRRAK